MFLKTTSEKTIGTTIKLYNQDAIMDTNIERGR
jgi:hypothetical protein